MTIADISVVIPLYNRANTILASLDSVARQTLLPARLVVVDDGSSDDSASRVARWLAVWPGRVGRRLIRQPNRGVAAARNRGFAAARPCALVAFLDSDDVWPPDFLERTSAALEGSSAAVAATCDRESHYDHGTRVDDLSSFAIAPIVWILKRGAGIASATLFRAAAIERRGGFDESLLSGEDIALFLPLALDGPWLHVPGRPVVFDRGRARRGASEPNLSGKFRDNYRRWARVYEQFVVHGGGCRAVAETEYRSLLGKAWYRAGRELGRGGYLDEACDCYSASIAWNCRSFKTWQHLALAWLRRSVGSATSSLSGRYRLTESPPDYAYVPRRISRSWSARGLTWSTDSYRPSPAASSFTSSSGPAGR